MGHTTCRGPREDQTKSPCSLMRTRPKNVCSPLIINVFTDTFDAFLYPRVLTVCVCVCVCVCVHVCVGFKLCLAAPGHWIRPGNVWLTSTPAGHPGWWYINSEFYLIYTLIPTVQCLVIKKLSLKSDWINILLNGTITYCEYYPKYFYFFYIDGFIMLL